MLAAPAALVKVGASLTAVTVTDTVLEATEMPSVALAVAALKVPRAPSVAPEPAAV